MTAESGRPIRRRVAQIAAILFIAASLAPAADTPELVYKRSSLYHQIFVYRAGSVMTLAFSHTRDVTQSRVDTADLRRHMLEYSALSFCGLLYRPSPKRVLVIGLGGGVIPREMHYYFPDATVDVVEIDPDVPTVAQTFFRFRTDERLRVYVEDGRVFVRRLGRKRDAPKYDYVVLDAFNADYIPFHLMTREFLEEVKAVTADDGVVVANVFSKNQLFHAEFKTYVDVFGSCKVYPGEKSTNAMIVSPGPKAATHTAASAFKLAEGLQKEHNFSFDLRWVALRLQPGFTPRADAMILTDNCAPVEVLRFEQTDY